MRLLKALKVRLVTHPTQVSPLTKVRLEFQIAHLTQASFLMKENLKRKNMEKRKFRKKRMELKSSQNS